MLICSFDISCGMQASYYQGEQIYSTKYAKSMLACNFKGYSFTFSVMSEIERVYGPRRIAISSFDMI
ncbi:hypothetical protein VCHA51O444_10333 [Vibrio chagasii]|nr:hypothetical protein VCHA51O444_10333 [Vibrio chagasii]CAH7331561.1 hypothetical protein VCHA53O474_30145 [Vibrio chagasii]